MCLTKWTVLIAYLLFSWGFQVYLMNWIDIPPIEPEKYRWSCHGKNLIIFLKFLASYFTEVTPIIKEQYWFEILCQELVGSQYTTIVESVQKTPSQARNSNFFQGFSMPKFSIFKSARNILKRFSQFACLVLGHSITWLASTLPWIFLKFQPLFQHLLRTDA